MEKFSIEKKYLYIALIFGILFVFIVPPFQSPDEDSHFKKAYQVSKGKFYPEVKKNVIGNYFPTEMLNYINIKTKYIGNRDKKYKYSEMVLDQYTKLNYEERKYIFALLNRERSEQLATLFTVVLSAQTLIKRLT